MLTCKGNPWKPQNSAGFARLRVEGPLGADDVLPQNGEGPEGIRHLPRLELMHLAASVVRQSCQEVFVVDVGLGKGHGLEGIWPPLHSYAIDGSRSIGR